MGMQGRGALRGAGVREDVLQVILVERVDIADRLGLDSVRSFVVLHEQSHLACKRSDGGQDARQLRIAHCMPH